jgi:hypothetical protein
MQHGTRGTSVSWTRGEKDHLAEHQTPRSSFAPSLRPFLPRCDEYELVHSLDFKLQQKEICCYLYAATDRSSETMYVVWTGYDDCICKCGESVMGVCGRRWNAFGCGEEWHLYYSRSAKSMRSGGMLPCGNGKVRICGKKQQRAGGGQLTTAATLSPRSWLPRGDRMELLRHGSALCCLK